MATRSGETSSLPSVKLLLASEFGFSVNRVPSARLRPRRSAICMTSQIPARRWSWAKKVLDEALVPDTMLCTPSLLSPALLGVQVERVPPLHDRCPDTDTEAGDGNDVL